MSDAKCGEKHPFYGKHSPKLGKKESAQARHNKAAACWLKGTINIIVGGVLFSKVSSYVAGDDLEQTHLRIGTQSTMDVELRTALQSRDYRQLDDFLVVWNDRLSSSLRKQIDIRRNELYIEADDQLEYITKKAKQS